MKLSSKAPSGAVISKYTVHKNGSNQYYFILVAKTGETLLTSELFYIKLSCKAAIASTKRYAAEKSNYKKESSKGQYFFILKMDNGEKIATSMMYSTPEDRDKAMEKVMREGPSAILIQTTR